MVKRPFMEFGIVDTNLEYSKIGIYKTIEAIKIYAKESETIRADDINVLEDSEFHNSVDSVTLTIPLKYTVNCELNSLFGKNKYGGGNDIIDLYWENFTSKNRRRWKLSVGGRKLCGIKYGMILDGSENYENCPCKEYLKTCQKITEILTQFNIQGKRKKT